MLGETLERWVMDEVACAATLRGPDFRQQTVGRYQGIYAVYGGG